MGMKKAETALYRGLIKNIADLAGIMSRKEIARKLTQLASEIDHEAAINSIHRIEYERVKE